MNYELWNKCVEFHGHECPGLAIGFRACEVAIKKMGLKFSSDEELVCVTENDACGVDAVQDVHSERGILYIKGQVKWHFHFLTERMKTV